MKCPKCNCPEAMPRLRVAQLEGVACVNCGVVNIRPEWIDNAAAKIVSEINLAHTTHAATVYAACIIENYWRGNPCPTTSTTP